jgi:hypothetical protein
MTHFNIRLLSSNDIFLDSWNEGDIVQNTVRNNLKTRLLWITTRCEGLDRDMVPMMLMAQCVNHDICLPGMIMNLQFIVLDQF